MTCSRWRCLATALSPPPGPSARFFSSSTSHRHNNSNSPWPQLKRRASPTASDPGPEHPFSIGRLAPRKPAKGRRPSSNDDAAPNGANESSLPLVSMPDPSRLMLIVRGLSPNLKASDFHRLIPSDLSSWSVLKHVQQKRCPKTLEPLGIYYITFTSAVALSVYRDKLLRLHSLNKHKLHSADDLLVGNWQLSVPPQLHAGTEDIAEEANSFTLAPGSLEMITPERKRAGVPKNWWARQLGARVEQFGQGLSPPTVLLHVYPPTLTARNLAQLIEQDGHSRGCSWDVCEPLPLDEAAHSAPTSDQQAEQSPDPNLESESSQAAEQEPDHDSEPTSTIEVEQDPDTVSEDEHVHGEPTKARPLVDYETRERLRSRFVVVCADESEAQRFHRHWNRRVLTSIPGHEAEQNLVHASRINW